MFETRQRALGPAVGLEAEVNRLEARKSLRRLPVQLIVLIGVIWGESIARHHFSEKQASHWFVDLTPITICAVILVLALRDG